MHSINKDAFGFQSLSIRKSACNQILPSASSLASAIPGGSHIKFSRHSNLAVACAMLAKLDASSMVRICIDSLNRFDFSSAYPDEVARTNSIIEHVELWLLNRGVDTADAAWRSAYQSFADLVAPGKRSTSHMTCRMATDLGNIPNAIEQAVADGRDVYWVHIGGAVASMLDQEGSGLCFAKLANIIDKSHSQPI